ncbi:MAG: CehA/McbA family metallohydrolase [Acidobacteriota bacterium]|nr:CehA/McbA family metallohydrolase [Acidobacteriota bacterium]
MTAASRWIDAGLWSKGLLLGSLLTGMVLLAACGAPEPESTASSGRYYSVQLHLHGSLSEGVGTMAGQTRAAQELGGVDVLWWTDHDWRIARHTFVDSFDFDQLRRRVPIPHRGAPWSKRPRKILTAWHRRDGGEALAVAEQEISREALQGDGALELTARARPGELSWGWTGGEVDASGGRYTRPLSSEVTVELAVRPETALGENAQLEIRLALSRQEEGLAELVYRVGETGPRRRRTQGGKVVGVVPVAAPPEQWTRLTLPVSQDAQELDLGDGDNSLRRVDVRLWVRRGAEARVLVDDLRLQTLRDGTAVLALEEERAQELEAASGIVQHVGLEISYGVHFNAFLPRVELPDFDTFPHGMEPQATVDWVHERGGVVSYNHIFGAGDEPEEEVQEELAQRGELAVRERLYGADLLEVGYPQRVLPLSQHLAVWDRLSAAGTVVTGIGTSDSHDQDEGWRGGNNFLTWVWAKDTSRPGLIEGLRCGRAFFADPARFRGTLELTTADGRPMGQVIEPNGASQELVLEATGLPTNSRIRWIVDGRVAQEETSAAGQDAGGPTSNGPGDGSPRIYRSELLTTVGDPGFIRVEVWQGGRGLAFTNPLYFQSPASAPASSDPSNPLPSCRTQR